MMNKLASYLLIMFMLISCAANAGEEQDNVYSRLSRKLASFDHRMAGSANHMACLQAVEQELKNAGLETHRQTFNTIVPHTIVCELSVNGHAIGPVLPLGPNGATPNSLGEKPVKGPIVYLGQGSLAEMDGKPVKGCIAVLELGSSNMDMVFNQGARAIVFVGNPTATQWSVSKHFVESPMSVPRVYIDRETAQRGGLISQDGKFPSASLSLATDWKNTIATNLWTVINGKPGRKFDLESEEAIILAATLDTFGIVPGLCPQGRSAANAALLAEVATRLAAENPARSIFIVFFGSHYSAQEGARHFYYSVAKSRNDGTNHDPLDMREAGYREEFELVNGQLELLKQKDFLKSESEYLFDSKKLLRKKLDAWVNNINFEIQKIAFAISVKPTDELKHKEKSLKDEKTVWNEMKRMLHENNIAESSQKKFVQLVSKTIDDLEKRKNEVEAMIANNLSFQELARALENKIIVGHFGLDFSRDDQPWIFNMTGGDQAMMREATYRPGEFIKSLSVLNDVYDEAGLASSGTFGLYRGSMNGSFPPSALCLPLEKSMPSTVALMSGFNAYEMMTVGEAQNYDELPVKKEYDLSGMIGELTAFFKAAADSAKMSVRSSLQGEKKLFTEFTYLYSGSRASGVHFENYAKGSSEIEGPATGAIATASPYVAIGKPAIAGHSRQGIARVNSEGYVFSPMLRYIKSWDTKALSTDEYGIIERISQGGDKSETRLFHAFGGGMFTPYLPSSYDSIFARTILNAKNDAGFKYKYESCLPRNAVFYAGKDTEFKYLCTGLAILGSIETSPSGHGVDLDPAQMLSLNTIRRSAMDYALLNKSRLDVLRRKNIINDSIELLQAEAEQHLEHADEMRRKGEIRSATAHETYALALGERAYTPLRTIANDLVQAVVILLLLSIPFAFSLERLIMGAPTIYKQILGFAIFFILTFVLLYLVHPAFSLASAPVIIFLAFIIILLSGIVIYIVMSKFKQELKAIQGLASTVHGAGPESGTGMASVLIGISGMRNRPLKTFLTALTIVLLTFTILVFSSFTSKIGVVTTYLGKGTGHERIEVYRSTFMNIPKPFVDATRALYEKDYDIFVRSSCFKKANANDSLSEYMIYNPANGNTVQVKAILGVDPKERNKNANLHRLIPDWPKNKDRLPPLFLPNVVAKKLGAEKGQIIKLRGLDFAFAGVFDNSLLQNMAYVDESKVTPPDYESTVQAIGGTGDSGQQEIGRMLSSLDSSSFIWTSSEQTAIAGCDSLEILNSAQNVIMLYPKRDMDLGKTATEIADSFQGPVYVSSSDGTKQYFFTKALEGAGMSEILVPLLLGGLIIFSSLLGSIVDREREIFTYSALGLAPVDVATLFFAESSVYAVIGGMGGYLISQLVAKTLAFLASYGIFRPPEMNFSSLTATYTILLVMATVILSTIYPALKAGSSANPGVARKWKMPTPKGNDLRFVFPFTVSANDLAGILSFIREHFENHSDASLGSFAAKEVEIFREKSEDNAEESYGIQATVSLAPFDLGVFQKFRLYSQDSDIEGIKEVVIELQRVSGRLRAWIRGNRAFIGDLRNQFLLWRSLPIETVEHYRRQTETTAVEEEPGSGE